MDISEEKLLFDGDTDMEHYQVVDMVYEGRPARILFSGHHTAAQSGIPLDGSSSPLFDYNKRFMELIEGLQPCRVLLIGGGAFTLPQALLRVKLSLHIDVIELDPGLKAISEDYFGLQEDARLLIMHGEGHEYLARNTISYDLILIDAFVHEAIPASLSTPQAIELLHASLTDTGTVAVNIISTYRGHRAKVLHHQFELYKKFFNSVHVFPADTGFTEWQSQNFILTAQKTASGPVPYLRFPALDL